jgi:hypothetical protein
MSPRNRLPPADVPVKLTPKQWIDQAVTLHTIGTQVLIVAVSSGPVRPWDSFPAWRCS